MAIGFLALQSIKDVALLSDVQFCAQQMNHPADNDLLAQWVNHRDEGMNTAKICHILNACASRSSWRQEHCEGFDY